VLAAIAVGGMLGASARYGLAQLIQVGAGGFPWATFWTNLSGSLLLGVLLVVLVERRPPSRHLRPFLATGVIGAYTTFSTFAVEADLLLRDGRLAVAAAYVSATVVLGLLAVAAGIMLGRRLPYGGGPAVPVRPTAPGPLDPAARLDPPGPFDPVGPLDPGRGAGPPRRSS
jgi:CrcB protein